MAVGFARLLHLYGAGDHRPTPPGGRWCVQQSGGLLARVEVIDLGICPTPDDATRRQMLSAEGGVPSPPGQSLARGTRSSSCRHGSTHVTPAENSRHISSGELQATWDNIKTKVEGRTRLPSPRHSKAAFAVRQSPRGDSGAGTIVTGRRRGLSSAAPELLRSSGRNDDPTALSAQSEPKRREAQLRAVVKAGRATSASRTSGRRGIGVVTNSASRFRRERRSPSPPRLV